MQLAGNEANLKYKGTGLRYDSWTTMFLLLGVAIQHQNIRILLNQRTTRNIICNEVS